MRVLMTADTVGGVWTYALELARTLQNRAEFALATMGAPLTPAQRHEVASLPNLTVYESEYQLEWMDSPWEDVKRAGDWLLDLEQQVMPDVVHLNGYAHGALSWQSPTLIVGHSCVLSWWEAVKGASAPSRYERYRQAVTRGLNSVSLVIAPSAAMLDALERHYGVLPTHFVIPNWRSAHLFRVSSKKPYVLAAGRLWDEAKNIVTLARSAPRLPWPVFVAGDDVHPEVGRTAFANLRNLGRLSNVQVADWMGGASIFALPARYEPFGLTALEAALSGCALVLGDIPSLREVWGDAALYVPPDDDLALTAAILELIADANIRQALVTRAYKKARTYAPERIAARYYQVYRQLIEGQSSIELCEYVSSTTP